MSDLAWLGVYQIGSLSGGKRTCSTLVTYFMENTSANPFPTLEPGTTALSLTERHYQQWLDLLDKLVDTHAPMDEIEYCRRQVAQLHQELYLLRNNYTSLTGIKY